MTAHALGACAPGLPPLDANAYALYYPLGDFDSHAAPGGHKVAQVGEQLPEIDGAARALLVDATEADRDWTGVTDLPPAGDVDVLLLPSLTSCAFPASIGVRGAGSLVAPVAPDRALVVGGASTTPPPTLALHLDTGQIDGVSPDLLMPRAGATVTAFGAGALVAGGTDPRSGGAALANAEVYLSEKGGFDQQHPVLLSGPRANHGAVLLASGETLLVGGVGASGQVLASMEIVDPATRTVRAEGVASLAAPRQSPTVLRLASGEVLVTGGLDASGSPVPTIEWFSPDASQPSRRAQTLVAGSARAFAPLAGGGALAVIAPPAGAAAGFQNVWVVDADGGLQPAAPVEGTVTAPVLFGGAGGAPVLWTGGSDGRWLRWQPWSGAFAALGELDDVRASVGAATASGDPGLALWIDDAAQRVTGLRFDARGVFSSLAGPLLVNDATDLAPDRLSAPGVVAFDSTQGLTLAPGASAFVTDRTYADAVVDLDAPTGAPAIVVLRDELGTELEVGGVTCPGSLGARGMSIEVRRQGTAVRWSSGGASGTCPTPLRAAARVSIGVRGAPGEAGSVVRNLRVVRVGAT